MAFTPVNIMNLLGAAGGPTGNGTASNSPVNAVNAANAGVLFGDIISGLLLGGSAGPAMQAQLPFASQTDLKSEVPNFEQGFINQILATINEAPEPESAPVTGLADDLVATINSESSVPTGEMPASPLVGDQSEQGDDASPRTDKVTPTETTQTNLVTLLPQPAVVMNTNIKNAVESTPIELPQGRYDVVSSQVSDGSLQLQIVSQDNPNQQIKLSISLDALQGMNTNKVGSAGLEKLDLGVANTQSTFANLVAKLNTQSIEITQSNPNTMSQPATNASLTVSLFGGTTGSEILLRSQVRPMDLRATVANTRESKHAAPADPTIVADEAEPTILKSTPDRNVDVQSSSVTGPKTARAATVDQDSPFFKQFDQSNVFANKQETAAPQNAKVDDTLGQFKRLFESDSSDSKTTSKITNDKADAIFGVHKTTVDGTEISAKKTAQPVRFVIPEDIKTALKPAGREVTLRIEPEHLGPAKLSLSLTNDELSARLVVNTTAAKQTLEGSLDKLVSQLAKADIKVQQIQVLVSGEAPQHHLFERRPDWNRPERFRTVTRDDENNIEESIMQVTNSPAARGGYVGQGRVNLLA